MTERLLWLGVVAGAALVIAGLTQRPADPPTLTDSGVAAIVDGVVIREERFAAALKDVLSQPRAPQDSPELRRRVLDDLIEEELLISHGLALELPRLAALSRRRLLTDVIDALGAGVSEPSEPELIAFYNSHAEIGALSTRYRVAPHWFTGDGAMDRATVAAAALVARKPPPGANTPVAPPPSGWVVTETLRHYLGPGATRAVAALEVGEVTAPIASAGGVWVVQLVDREVKERRTLSEVREAVIARWSAAQRRQAVNAAVEALRRDAHIQTREQLLTP